MSLSFEGITLAIILAVLAGIVYSMRTLVILERKLSRIDLNIERMTEKIILEEDLILNEESQIENLIGIKNSKSSSSRTKKNTQKKSSKKKSSKRKSTSKKK